MAITNAQTTSFKIALFNAEMDFSSDTSDVFKIALYTEDATVTTATTAYSTSNEVVGSGYTAGGVVLTIAANPTSSGVVAYMDFDNPSWAASSITARRALIYKSGGSNPSVTVIDFERDFTTSSANFVIQMPLATAATAILRLT